MYELYFRFLSVSIENGIPFSFIMIFAVFIAVIDALNAKSNRFISLACE